MEHQLGQVRDHRVGIDRTARALLTSYVVLRADGIEHRAQGVSGLHRIQGRAMGVSAETLHRGPGGRWMRVSKALTAAGAAGALLGRRSRVLTVASGAALMAGSFCSRMGVYHAGLESAKDPKYTVVPQRERVDRGEPVRHQG